MHMPRNDMLSSVIVLPCLRWTCRSCRYPLEEHCVTTSDGYVLKMERMPRRSAPISAQSSACHGYHYHWC
jgi:hypothetical protein